MDGRLSSLAGRMQTAPSPSADAGRYLCQLLNAVLCEDAAFSPCVTSVSSYALGTPLMSKAYAPLSIEVIASTLHKQRMDMLPSADILCLPAAAPGPHLIPHLLTWLTKCLPYFHIVDKVHMLWAGLASCRWAGGSVPSWQPP